MTFEIINAIILGVVEGLTEFIPVSSTGHLLLMQRFFGFGDDDFGESFAVWILVRRDFALVGDPFCAAMAIVHRQKCSNNPQARRFILGVLIVLLAAVVGALAYKLIT